LERIKRRKKARQKGVEIRKHPVWAHSMRLRAADAAPAGILTTTLPSRAFFSIRITEKTVENSQVCAEKPDSRQEAPVNPPCVLAPV